MRREEKDVIKVNTQKYAEINIKYVDKLEEYKQLEIKYNTIK